MFTLNTYTFVRICNNTKRGCFRFNKIYIKKKVNKKMYVILKNVKERTTKKQ